MASIIRKIFEGAINWEKLISKDLLSCFLFTYYQGLREPYMFAASTVKRATDVKAPFLQCTTSFHVVSLTDLHSKLVIYFCELWAITLTRRWTSVFFFQL